MRMIELVLKNNLAAFVLSLVIAIILYRLAERTNQFMNNNVEILFILLPNYCVFM